MISSEKNKGGILRMTLEGLRKDMVAAMKAKDKTTKENVYERFRLGDPL